MTKGKVMKKGLESERRDRTEDGKKGNKVDGKRCWIDCLIDDMNWLSYSA